MLQGNLDSDLPARVGASIIPSTTHRERGNMAHSQPQFTRDSCALPTGLRARRIPRSTSPPPPPHYAPTAWLTDTYPTCHLHASNIRFYFVKNYEDARVRNALDIQ
ncbi:hypothetical protein J6590_069264 [Homalodisca vitripennis]|nr:hypothetical protein J6590_069264 [Homalodisca vitripennis]